MKPITKLIRKVKKHNTLHDEVKNDIVEYLSSSEKRIDEETLSEFLVALGVVNQIDKGIMSEVHYADNVCQVYCNDDKTKLVTKVFDLDDNLLFNINNYSIKSFCSNVRQYKLERNLFFNGLAFVTRSFYNYEEWGIVSDQGKILVRPNFKKIYYIYDLFQTTYFLVIDQYGRQGIIDQTGRVIMPILYSEIDVLQMRLSYRSEFIAVKNKRYYLILWECKYARIDGVYSNLGEQYKVNEIFNSFLPSRNSTYLAIKNNKYGWYNNCLKPIFKCKYKKIKVYSNDTDFYDEKIFVLIQDFNNKWGLFIMKGKIKLPFVYDRILAADNREFVVLCKSKNIYIYDFIKKSQMIVPAAIVPSSIKMTYYNKQVYFTARKSKTDKWAVFDSGFNMLTHFHFPYPPDIDLLHKTISAFVPEFRHNNAQLLNCYKYVFSWKEFFNLFGINQPKIKQTSKIEIDKTPIQRIKRTGLIFSEVSVAGIQYYEFYEICDHIQPKDELIMVGEPENPYDKYAIALYFKHEQIDYKLGYIPRTINRDIRTYLHDGSELKIIVKRIKSTEKVEYFIIDIIGV